MGQEIEEAFAFDADDIKSKVTTPLLTYMAISGDVFKGVWEQILNITNLFHLSA